MARAALITRQGSALLVGVVEPATQMVNATLTASEKLSPVRILALVGLARRALCAH